MQAVAQVNLIPPRYKATCEPTVWKRGCRVSAEKAKTIGGREVNCTDRIHRGAGGGMYEETSGVNWGITRRQKVDQTKKISWSKASSDSDEAIVSTDPTGQHNRLGSQGPLDESVWGWNALHRSDACPQGP